VVSPHFSLSLSLSHNQYSSLWVLTQIVYKWD
jgi:hypothetical protein